ncbi:MAG: hypothetical protein H8E66_33770 [Planctomycetes bacterium]|nr:hypothetical protein [Planctomycetota bacterium]
MQRYVRRAFWICILGGVVCLSSRLVWLSSDTETGLQTLRTQWWDATLGLPLGSDQPIASREPVVQAEFWLGETDRVLKLNSDDAQVAMGAALVLDGPGTDFMGRYLRNIDRFGGIGFPEIDREGIKQAEDAFEVRCKDRCLQLAAKATQLDGDHVEWWRLRALLLFHESMYTHGESPRDADWLKILDECARHDPENALYDYLVANHFWDNSADVEFSGEDDRLIVKDVERFEQAISRFERGQAKPVFAVGDAGFTATATFLDHSRLPLTSHISIINSRTVHYQRQLLLRDLWRWQDYRAQEAADTGNIPDAVNLHRQNLDLIAQYTNTGPTQAYDNVPIYCKVATTTSMRKLSDSHPGEVSSGHSEDIIALQKEAMLRQKVVERAGRALAKGKPQRRSGLTISNDLASVLAAVFVGIAPTLVILLLAFGIAATVALRWLAGDNAPVVGLAGHLLATASAFVATVVLFGLAPAQIISGDVQAWSLSILLVVTPFALACWIGWSWLRRRDFKFSLRAMLIAVFVACLLFGLISIARPDKDAFSDFPFALTIPARGLEGLGVDTASLGREFDAINGQWFWALCQWTAYFGHYLFLVLWVGLVATICGRKIRKQRSEDSTVAMGHLMTGILRSFGQPALAFSVVLLLVYLIVTPQVVLTIEKAFQENIAFARRPASHWEKVENAVRAVVADEQQMKNDLQNVEAEVQETATQDFDPDHELR